MTEKLDMLLPEAPNGGGLSYSSSSPTRVHSFAEAVSKAMASRRSSPEATDCDIARELHDSVGQQLTGISLLLQRLHRELSKDALPQANEIHRILGQMLHVNQEVQCLTHRTLLAKITPDQFLHAVRALMESVRHATGTHCILSLQDVALPDDATAEHLYRILQEAIHNTIKHAEASCLRVKLKQRNDAIVLIVHDDGKGIPRERRIPRDVGEEGMGLGSMRFRAKAIGAKLNIRSRPKCGTTVRCVIQATK